MQKMLVLLTLYFAGIGTLSCQRTKPRPDVRTAVQVSNDSTVQRLSREIERLRADVARRDSMIAVSIERQRTIVNQFNRLYETIHAAGGNTDLQLAINDSLLAEHRRTPLARE